MTKQLQEFVDPSEKFHERLAAVHALMRQYGAEFDHIHPKRREGLNDLRVAAISMPYFIYLPKLNWLCLSCYFFRKGQIAVEFKNNGNGVYNQMKGYARWGTHYPVPGSSFPWAHGRKHGICPEFEDAEGL